MTHLFYYIFLLMMTVLGIIYGLIFSSQDAVYDFFFILKLSWLIPFPYAIVNFYSFLRYPIIRRYKYHLEHDPTHRIYFRYVTRGMNPVLVQDNINIALSRLSKTLPSNSYKIEVVTDNPLYLTGDVTEILVPDSYKTINGTLFKGRSLHYALTASEATDEDWVVHLDEETQFDDQTAIEIYNYTYTSQDIGQGVILYGAKEIVNWITTLADSIRVGDDFGRFRLQYKHHRAWFGIHGSYIVVKNAIEKQIGFDHGVRSSITEDAYFALFAQDQGVEFDFLTSYMYEKSPFSIKDFIKQRHRWFGGLWYCVLDTRIKSRWTLFTFMIMWSISWLSIIMVYVNLLFPTSTPLWLGIMGGVSFSYYMTLYIIGYVKTFSLRDGVVKYVIGLIFQILLMPLFSIMEASGVIYGLIKPPTSFYIVKKEV